MPVKCRARAAVTGTGTFKSHPQQESCANGGGQGQDVLYGQSCWLLAEACMCLREAGPLRCLGMLCLIMQLLQQQLLLVCGCSRVCDLVFLVVSGRCHFLRVTPHATHCRW